MDLFAAREPAPRPLALAEAKAAASAVIDDCYELPAPETNGPVTAVRGCRRQSPRIVECELGDTIPAGCALVRATLRSDGWIAADPRHCGRGPSFAAALIERRAAFCLEPDPVPRRPCRTPWSGVEGWSPICSSTGCEGGDFGGTRVCWRVVVSGKRTTRCVKIGRR